MTNKDYEAVMLTCPLNHGFLGGILSAFGITSDEYQKYVDVTESIAHRFPDLECQRMLDFTDVNLMFLGKEDFVRHVALQVLQQFGMPVSAYGPREFIDDIFQEYDSKPVESWLRNKIGFRKLEFAEQPNYQ